MANATATHRADSTRSADIAIPAGLLLLAAGAWWYSAVNAADMDDVGGMDSMGAMSMSESMSESMTFGAFVVGWAVMMAAMMFPAISPVVRLYRRAAGRGTVAPVPVFVSGYLLVWAAIGVPAYWAWRALADPLDAGEHWVGRLAGVVFLAAAAYQLTPLKRMCLRHCRSPMSVFTHVSGDLARPWTAVRVGAAHGAYCLGCCWALMAVLVALGTMHLGWMVALAVVIFVEKVLPRGEAFATAVAGAAAVVGAALLIAPSTIDTLT